MQYRGIATPVQEDERLLLTRQALGDGIDQLGREPVLELQPARVDQPHLRQLGGAGAMRQGQQQIAAALRVVPGLERRRGRAQYHRHIAVSRAPHGQIACRIAQPFLLFIGGVVFFIDHDEAQLGQRHEDRHARAEHHAGFATLRPRPGLHALAVGQTAVHHGHAIGAHHGLQARP